MKKAAVSPAAASAASLRRGCPGPSGTGRGNSAFTQKSLPAFASSAAGGGPLRGGRLWGGARRWRGERTTLPGSAGTTWSKVKLEAVNRWLDSGMAVVNTPSAGSRKVSFCTVQPSGSRFCVNDDSNACVPKGKVGTKIATHCQVPRTAHHLPKTRTPPERVWGKGGVSGTPHGGRYRRRVARFEAITRKMQSARNVKLMTGDLRSALEIAGAAKLDAHLRFVKRTNDVVTTICYLLHKTPLMKEGALAPITLTMNNL